MEHVLSHRDKNSSIRTLKLESRLSSTALNCLMECLTINNIQELDVKINNPLNHVNLIPWDILINCGSLKVLRLNFMYLIVEPIQSQSQSLVMNQYRFTLHTMTLSNIIIDSLQYKFTDSMFPCLKKLTLHSCSTPNGLNFNCSGLEDLVIRECNELNQLDIYGLKLESLKVHSCFTKHDIDTSEIKIIAPVIKYLKWVGNHIGHIPVLETSSSLEKAVIGIFHDLDEFDNYMLTPEGPEQRACLSNMMIALSHVKTLKFRYSPTDILSDHDYYDKSCFVNKFESLRKLEISTRENMQGFATLFKNTPNIHTLVIKFDFTNYAVSWNFAVSWSQFGYVDDDNFWEDQIPELISFLNHLKAVQFVGFDEYDKSHCDLAKFLLEHGHVLEDMNLYLLDIHYRPAAAGWERIKYVKELSWVSSKVKVDAENSCPRG